MQAATTPDTAASSEEEARQPDEQHLGLVVNADQLALQRVIASPLDLPRTPSKTSRYNTAYRADRQRLHSSQSVGLPSCTTIVLLKVPRSLENQNLGNPLSRWGC